MNAPATSVERGDGRLWVISFWGSLLGNALVLGLLGWTALQSVSVPRPQPAAAQRTTIIISREMLTAATVAIPATAAPSTPRPRFSPTLPDQTAATPPTTRGLSGERNTRATRSHSPLPSGPSLPSQAGIQKPSQDLETTENSYQDGGPTAATAPQTAPTAPSEILANAAATPPAPLLSGPTPVAVPVPKPEALAAPPTPPSPNFQGNPKKAAIVGSISRTGRSALDVTDTPLGRYQATISRAVEQEWQRNCVRHRNFITPGFLTVRFYVEPSGKVRTVQFVGEMVVGEVQKGFTLSSIREAAIPPMPAAIKKDFRKQPLEIIFNFYF